MKRTGRDAGSFCFVGDNGTVGEPSIVIITLVTFVALSDLRGCNKL
ncbi:hypothetical protein [Vallitalea guaymasensis]|nr:hypothetical protein [Vallitalea guaymasensis]